MSTPWESAGAQLTNNAIGGGFTFSRAEAQSHRDQWVAERTSLQDDDYDIERLENAQPPSQDAASIMHATALNERGQAARTQWNSRRVNVQDQINKLESAMRTYDEAEAAHLRAMRKI
jgi:hypothetical protein